MVVTHVPEHQVFLTDEGKDSAEWCLFKQGGLTHVLSVRLHPNQTSICALLLLCSKPPNGTSTGCCLDCVLHAWVFKLPLVFGSGP